MKKTLSLILALLIAMGCLPGAALAADVDAPKKELDPAAVEAQSFALAMACDEARGREDMSDLAAQAAGWYAAWLWRTEDIDLVSEGRIREFLRSLRCEDEELYPEEWEEKGLVRRLRGEDGRVLLDYTYHKERLESVLGVTAEFRLEPFTYEAVTFTVIRHLVAEETVEREYTVAFEPCPESEGPFAWQLISITAPAPGPKMDPGLPFDWDMLTACNRYAVLLDLYPGIRIQNSYNSEDMAEWILLRGGELVRFTLIGDTVVFGFARGCYFSQDEESGRMVVSSLEEERLDGETDIGFFDRFAPVDRVELLEQDGELIRAVCLSEYGLREVITVDRGTLALREYSLELENGSNLSTETYTYDAPVPDASFMDGWADELRTVTVHWERFEGGEILTAVQEVRIPADWEYLPADIQWGDYICWMDEGYTQPYAYPGDGVDYEFYLTTAKG